ncbi:MAG: type II toxin-antitoxin system RatA family toxin [Hyphomicrobiaceae bacterium]|nr:type II toxin-antitoxin system RatA family toxin [Hyphomicrobiaceae bacterium]
MPKFETTRRVPYTPQQMYQVVADVEAYPQFLPLCEALHVESREVAGDKTTIIATMSVGYKTIRESFRTRVTLAPGEPAILVEYLDGPFKRLENRWRFLPAATGSDVHFFIDYEFRSVMLSVLMGALFDKAFRRFSEAFEDRARTVYGPVQPARA